MKAGEVFVCAGHTLRAESTDFELGCEGCVGDPPQNGRRIGEPEVPCGNLPECDATFNEGTHLRYALHEVLGNEPPAILKRDFGRQEVLIAAHATRPFTVALCGGKYRLTNTCGKLTCLRGGEAWPAGDEALSGDSLSLSMVQRIQEMEERMQVAIGLLKHGNKIEAMKLLNKKEWES